MGKTQERKNAEIRYLLFQHNIQHYLVAQKLCINESTLSRWLRYELPESRKKEIISAINELISGN